MEIIENVFDEIKSYGHEDPRRKLIAGIVLTGGGAQLKHVKQLVEYITGMDTRIGYPNEHLAGNSDEEISSPMYATAVGLVMNSIENHTQSAVRVETTEVPEKVSFKKDYTYTETKVETTFTETKTEAKQEARPEPKPEPVRQPEPVYAYEEAQQESTEQKMKRSFFDRYVDKIKDFLDNAE